ncbi:Origin recognition complex, subunit 1 [Coemansia thaxteri]|uniref:Origin recognition complex subunit 1 n=1 Tax=Coemansia thaxteri TaxID=2663907 RepID=A0A9W8BGI5_9FUNG|nr:Origin recognition complex, subunit 1 [Coemansia thaxteri]KAJ2005485.1 Origin recognition complex, subunit 1 [Coemansia thaxteri]KAJ2471741.1 Origin recognition complex, subunit 1 [Coemansia sp. RSA 2322]KAJ2476579.1 Origin recognition complex, subunit 1 [Coemansia sp. RSA 2320]
MPPTTQQSKIASRIDKAFKQTSHHRAKRQQHQLRDSDDEAEDVIEWGQRLDDFGAPDARASGGSATPSTRRVTRGSGMTNKDLYKSVIINGTEYCLGQAVQVKSSSDAPYLAIIYKLWENELGRKQVVARWLLRKSEIFLNKKMNEVHAEPGEVFYSNADDLITPDQILASLDVLSHAAYQAKLAAPAAKKGAKSTDVTRFCRRYFNEQSAFTGELDWDSFYGTNRILDPVIDAEMFKKHAKKKPMGKEAAAQAGRARVQARRGRPPAAPTPRAAKRIRSRVSDDEGNDPSVTVASDDDNNDSGVGSEVDQDDFKPAKRGPRKQAAMPRTPARARRASSAASLVRASTPATAPKRKMRLQDIQPAAVSATILRRASRMSRQALVAAPDGATIYEVARQRLHVSAVPDTLPCREDEFAEIYGHLYNTIEERNSMCMYISGVPGTGKTATVHEVIRTLQENAEEGDLPDFQYVELNGMKMVEPAQAYTQLWQAIAGEKVTPKHASQLLDKHFSTPSPRRHTYVVLMDELDLLVTKSQSIMYNFFDWPHRPHAKLVVVAIANTMDLPERMLNHKVSSRLGLTRINFQPYSHQQLMTIVQSRLEGCAAFDVDAIELCARKISAVSGDARRALDVCRRAVEIVEAEWTKGDVQAGAKRPRQGPDSGHGLVTMMVIDRAVKEMYASGNIAFIQNASLQQKVFLVSLRAAIRKAGIPEVSLGDVAFVHRQLCQLHELAIPSYDQLAKICSQLGATRCILAESSILDVHQLVRLAIAEDDITVALRPDPLFQKIATS